jgi:hypothetical protein
MTPRLRFDIWFTTKKKRLTLLLFLFLIIIMVQNLQLFFIFRITLKAYILTTLILRKFHLLEPLFSFLHTCIVLVSSFECLSQTSDINNSEGSFFWRLPGVMFWSAQTSLFKCELSKSDKRSSRKARKGSLVTCKGGFWQAGCDCSSKATNDSLLAIDSNMVFTGRKSSSLKNDEFEGKNPNPTETWNSFLYSYTFHIGALYKDATSNWVILRPSWFSGCHIDWWIQFWETDWEYLKAIVNEMVLEG